MEQLKDNKFTLARLWRNPSIQRIVVILGLLLLSSILFIWLYSNYSTDNLKKDWLEKEAAMLGRLYAEDPALADKYVSSMILTEALTPASITEGRQVLERSGITSELESELIPLLNQHYSRTFWSLITTALALFTLIGYLFIRESRKQLVKVRSLALSLEQTVKLNKPMTHRPYDEGELGLLAAGAHELTTRLQETIEQLHQEKAFLKEMVADISHQLKTPLASLMIYIELLREGKVDEQLAAEFLDTCRRELDRMEWLTLTLLKLARLEADALEMSMKEAPLVDTVTTAIHAISGLAQDKNVKLQIEEPNPRISLIHDSHWLAEAITNLLKNAVDHSPQNSEVLISWERTSVFTRLYVKDQGIGIDEMHLPHIFKKFYRASSGGSGVGLGLPLAKLIVERHGGILSAAPNPSGGTSFILTLPHHSFRSNTKLTKL